MAISPQGFVRSTSCLVLLWGFRGRRIQWRYFRLRQIQDGRSAAILENSNGDISAADRPIYSVFGSRMGFSGSADQMALFPVSTNPRWRSRHLEKFKWRYLAEYHLIYSIFGSRMGFLVLADRMALIPV